MRAKEFTNKQAYDPEMVKVKNFAKVHYPFYGQDKDSAFDKFVQRSLKHAKDTDTHQEQDIARLKKDMFLLKQKIADAKQQQLDELSFLGSPCTKDCSGHQAGYNWSKQRGGITANSWSQSFNNGTNLAAQGK